MSENLDPSLLVEVRKDIFRMQRTLEEIKIKEADMVSQYPESVATTIGNHALVQFCKRFKPVGFDIDALEIMILDFVSKSRPVRERKGADGSNEYFYEYTVDDITLVFLVKNHVLVTVWRKDGLPDA